MFDQAGARIAGVFRRMEPRATARAYLIELLSGTERKNCQQLAKHAGHARPASMQRLLRTARWDVAEVRNEVRRYILDHLGTGDGVLVVDETGFLKKGRGSAGVQRQYTGTAGRIENSKGRRLPRLRLRQGTSVDRPSALPARAHLMPGRRTTPQGRPCSPSRSGPSPFRTRGRPDLRIRTARPEAERWST
ncbi:transposase [Kitasatospora griseola]